jgi:hypothetical protein
MTLSQTARALAIKYLRQRSVVTVARAACWVALVGLAVMAASIIYPMPLLIIFATSVGQVIGVIAFLLYLLSILMDVIRGSDHSPDAPGPARKFRAEAATSDATTASSDSN